MSDQVPDLRPRHAKAIVAVGSVLLVLGVVVIVIAALAFDLYREWTIWTK